MREALELHVSLGVPLATLHADALVRLLELLKAIEATCHRRSGVLAGTTPAMLQQLARDAQGLLTPIVGRIGMAGRSTDAELDALAATSLVSQMLDGVCAETRINIAELALEVVAAQPFIGPEDASALRHSLRRVRELASWQRRLRRVTDCSFTYWARALLPHYLACAWKRPMRARRLPYALAALRDAASLLRRARHVPLRDGKDSVDDLDALLPAHNVPTADSNGEANGAAPEDEDSDDIVEEPLAAPPREEADWRTLLLEPYEESVIEQLRESILDPLWYFFFGVGGGIDLPVFLTK